MIQTIAEFALRQSMMASQKVPSTAL